MVTTSSSSGSQNMAFLSSPGSTNELDTANIQVSAVSTPVSTVNTHDNTANLSDATVGNGFEVADSFAKHESKKVFPENWPTNQDSSRRTVNVEDTSSKAMVSIDVADFDWSYMADDEALTNMALMAFSNSEKEKESNQIKIDNTENASKSLDKLIRSQITDNSRTGVGFAGYNVVAPPPTSLFAPQQLICPTLVVRSSNTLNTKDMD
nr:hypothetical protein [Tanacetum cinerariifolium]